MAPLLSSLSWMRSIAASICSTLTGRLRSASVIEARSLARVELGARAVLLDHRRQRDLGALVGGEALVAARAAAAPADDVAFVGVARLDDLGVLVAAERAAHRRGVAERSAVDREVARQRRDLGAHRGDVGLVVRAVEHVGDQVGRLARLALP